MATERVPAAQMGVLESLHADFAGRMASSLSAYLNTAVTAMPGVLSESTFAQHLADTTDTTGCLATITVPPASALMMLQLDKGIASPILELLLGGSLKSAANISRDFTDVEQSLIEAVVRVLLGDLRESWRGLNGTDFDFGVQWLGSMASATDLMPGDEAVVLAPIEVTLEEGISGGVCFVLPCLLLRELRTRFEPVRPKAPASPENRNHLTELLSPMLLVLESRLQGTTLTLAEILKLTEGALLVLDWPLDRPIDGVVNDVSKFRGHLVTSGKKRGFLVDGPH
jgi:flagellar motor switch protein FliM